MKKKVVLAGGTGFVGKYFENHFMSLGYEVRIISRQSPHISWSNNEGIRESIENSDMLINLAGKTVNCRYNAKNKEEILQSRTETTKILGNAIKQCENPPSLWINSSTATIYRHAEDNPMTEDDGIIGSGFSVHVAKEWERSFFEFQLPETRQIALRIAIVLGDDGGVMTPYKNLVKFGLGGHQGSGNQKFSWIHIDDLFNIVLFLRKNEELSGVFNCSSPHPVTNREFMAYLRKAMNRKIGLPCPRPMLEMGAFFMRTETELILKSRWVIPERLVREGYEFKFDKLDAALQQILKSSK
ncbi:TIGR01777 family oxidoreductase [Peribacillus sp. TH14]|uniref:TIGR01777 family oxidoreductase n=1 Tax=Peribacillus sp. TH14 TaxID=2798481 RepID=UPI001911A492|nr:TIGR01777 family oxidoreductase [Peribacillus sp. TH14]MBK5498589.1 TIGR01777 family oxidoreductase [Peribacillus sp. TH14]